MNALDFILQTVSSRVEGNPEIYVLTDFKDSEQQETIIRDLFAYDMQDEYIEQILQEASTQECFDYLQSVMDEFRRMVLRSYAEMQELPKQFRRDVL